MPKTKPTKHNTKWEKLETKPVKPETKPTKQNTKWFKLKSK